VGKDQLQAAVEQIRRLAAPELARQRTDQQLLHDFRTHRDETAFAALVQRHASMVLRVCRHVLHHAQDAEDAFQATFLVLARNSTTIRKKTALASWLHGVAYRTAMRARRDFARRRFHERRAVPMTRTEPAWELALRELQSVVDRETQRLPEKYRAPFVLCCLESKSKNEAASQLGWKVGTVSSRLAQARKLLQTRLSRRGVSLSAVLGAAALGSDAANAGVPRLLIDGTVKAAVQYATGKAVASGLISAEVATLVKAVGKSMLITKIKSAVIVMLAIGIIATGGTLTHQVLAQPKDSELAQAQPTPETKSNPQTGHESRTVSNQEDDHGTIVITGQVLDPADKPIALARVGVLAQGPLVAGEERMKGGPWLGLETTNDSGHFRLTLHKPFPKCWNRPAVMAAAPGFGFVWRTLDPDAGETGVVIRLHRERILRGRVLDAQGQPAAGAQIEAAYVSTQSGDSGLYPCSPPGPTWPAPTTTDSQGRFVLRGLGRDQHVMLDVKHGQSSPQVVRVKPNTKDGEELRVSLTPSRKLSGRVVYGDTGKPVPRARLTISGMGQDTDSPLPSDVRADADGHFEARTYAAESYWIYAFAPPGESYVGRSLEFSWPEGVVRDSLNIALMPGALVRGIVKDARTGQPVAGALVGWWPEEDIRHGRPGVLTQRYTNVPSRPDGTFQVGVLPGPGLLMVHGPTPDYIHRELFHDRIRGTLSKQPIGAEHESRLYPDGWVRLDVKPGSVTEGVHVTLSRGVTVEGRLVGPQGQTVKRARMLCQLNVLPSHVRAGYVELYGGRFRLQGCDPSRTYPVLFQDAENDWGAAVTLLGKQAGGEPVTVRLGQCGSTKGRLVDTRGNPVKDFPSPPDLVWLEVILIPEKSAPSASGKATRAEGVILSYLDRRRYGNIRSDRDGLFTIPALIPGATYRISSGMQPVGSNRMSFEKEFTVESGKMLDLSDLPIERYRIQP
jgi:RNA polymerase sigma factor (sigma-70 family)